MRKALDLLYDAAGYLAAFFMIGVLLMVLASVVGRLVGLQLRGSDGEFLVSEGLPIVENRYEELRGAAELKSKVRIDLAV